MSRDPSLYLEEILSAADAIAGYLSGLDYERFLGDRKTQDAVLRNLILIGETVKQLPAELWAAFDNPGLRVQLGLLPNLG